MCDEKIERGAAQGSVTDEMVERAAKVLNARLDVNEPLVGVSREMLTAALSTPPAPAPDAGEAAAYAERLAVALYEKHYAAHVPEWKPLRGDLIGLLTQIDNMTAVFTRPTPQPPAVEAEAVDPETGMADLSLRGILAATHAEHEAALKAKTDENERLTNLVEQAFRHGIGYAQNVKVDDVDLAWETSRVRAALRALRGEGKQP